MENGLAGIWGEEIAGAGEYLRAGEIPGRSTGDPGRVPLSLPKNAKDGGHVPQLASLRQVAHVLQRTLWRAKRKPEPPQSGTRVRSQACAGGWMELGTLIGAGAGSVLRYKKEPLFPTHPRKQRFSYLCVIIQFDDN